MRSLTRRTFLRHSLAAVGAASLAPRSWSQVIGANNDVRVAVVGLNGRGRDHLRSLGRIAGVRVVALCDVDTAVLEKTKALAVNGQRPYEHLKTYVDVRELLDSRDIDAITIATPNHWHALQGIWACQAGKDAYVEKPVSHNVWEGRQLVAAAAKYGRVVQAGMQIRSGAGLAEAREWIRAGNLGKITAARGLCYKRRVSIGQAHGVQPIPASVDYDLWCGPAPKEPLRRLRLHYDWHWVHATGNGDLGNQGIHQMDLARWFLGETGLAPRTLSIGGRLGYDDDGETPNTQLILHDYARAPLIFEVRGLPAKVDTTAASANLQGAAAAGAAAGTMDRYRGVTVGNVIECEGGSLVVPGYFDAIAYDRDGKVIRKFQGSDSHMANFIDVVRSRRMADLFGPMEDAHVSSALCHLGNVSHRLGRAASPADLRERVGSGLFAEAFGRMVEHLARNEVNLEKTPLTLGMPLEIEPKTERCVGPHAEAANQLLTREYRAPYVVPKLHQG